MIYENIYEETNKIYESILVLVPLGEKYYHLGSLYNFILHFNELGTMQDKYRVNAYFKKYHDFVNNNQIENSFDSKSVFDEYIRPIGEIYTYSLGYKFIVDISTIVLVLALCNLLLLILSLDFKFYLIFNALGTFLIIRNIRIRKSKKFYGFNY